MKANCCCYLRIITQWSVEVFTNTLHERDVREQPFKIYRHYSLSCFDAKSNFTTYVSTRSKGLLLISNHFFFFFPIPIACHFNRSISSLFFYVEVFISSFRFFIFLKMEVNSQSKMERFKFFNRTRSKWLRNGTAEWSDAPKIPIASVWCHIRFNSSDFLATNIIMSTSNRFATSKVNNLWSDVTSSQQSLPDATPDRSDVQIWRQNWSSVTSDWSSVTSDRSGVTPDRDPTLRWSPLSTPPTAFTPALPTYPLPYTLPTTLKP
jgi:hypothetical protein